MTTLTVTARGQVTFRKDVLQHLGIKPGEKIELDYCQMAEVCSKQPGPPERLRASSGCSRAGQRKSPPLKKSTRQLHKGGPAKNEGCC